jgi:hypothetical protein
MMPRLIDIIHRLFPDGTLPGQGRQWRRAPVWPPDVFACGAVLASMSGAYSRARYTSQWSSHCCFNDEYRKTVRTIGAAWADGHLPDEVSALWSRLLTVGQRHILEADAEWWDTAMKLMIIADEAATGIGFLSSGDDRETAFADYLLLQYTHHVQRLGHRRARLDPKFDLPNLPRSLCWMIPPTEFCVQPKARTPEVGFTLRSLSHNLALLPPAGEITTRWRFGTPAGRSTDQALNLLLVPFPFKIDSSCFVGGSQSFGEGSIKFFSLRQNWLRSNGSRLSSRDLSAFFAGLVHQARREVRNVHGLVLPETALADSHVKAIARDLAANTGLELFVCGVFRSARGRTNAQNKVYAAIFHDHRVLVDWDQAKHHRWRLDSSQIRRYHLGDALDPKDTWWEQIELQPRTCTFYVFRYGASLAALVCEDLARIDPVQAAVRSVGPNLVIVLLMDGPQLERRWPGRYATVLADDPGSAVLTLTSLGMIRRSVMPGEDESRQIALWKDAAGVAQELKLPRGAHGLLLTLSQSSETSCAQDGRSDRGATARLSLSGVRAIFHPRPPVWIDMAPDGQ